MIFSHSKRFGIRDTSAVVTLGKASVTATCHARNPLFFNPYFFTVYRIFRFEGSMSTK